MKVIKVVIKTFSHWLLVMWHSKFHKKASSYYDFEKVSGCALTVRRCTKCNVMITYTLGRNNNDSSN